MRGLKMVLRNRLHHRAANAIGVLRMENMRRIVSNILRVEKNAVLGVAAETAYALALMLAVFVMALLLTLLHGL